MRLGWRQRLEAEPRLREMENWPLIEADLLPAKHRQTFLRNQTVVAQALRGDTLNCVARTARMSTGNVHRILKRCLGGDSEHPAPLSAALVPGYRCDVNNRRAPLPSLADHRGCANAFQHLLDQVPGLQRNLDALIERKFKDDPRAQTLKPQLVHAAFKQLLVEADWPTNVYPYTTQKMAYESVRKYLHERVRVLEQIRQQTKTPARKLRVDKPYERALQRVQIDAQTLDIHPSFCLQLGDETIPLRAARPTLLAAIDVATRCLLAYHLVLAPKPNQQDLLALMDKMIQPWAPMALETPGFAYTPGACFPSGLPSTPDILPSHIELDNALEHLAHSVRDFICEQLGATLSLGLPAAPKTRNWIEAAFNYVNQHVTHRFASTTGSHVRDPKRESRKNSKRVPSVTVRSLDEALSVVLTDYNVRQQASLEGTTPLSKLERQLAQHYRRMSPPPLKKNCRPFTGREVCSLKWLRHEGRAPHVTFYGPRYQGPGLIDAVATESEVVIEFDRRDIRSVKAYTLDGVSLGTLQAPRAWRRFPHSLATRQRIRKAVTKDRHGKKDPLVSHFLYALDRKEKPKHALSLLRIYDEYTSADAEGVDLANELANGPKSDSRLAKRKSPAWSSKIAHRRDSPHDRL